MIEKVENKYSLNEVSGGLPYPIYFDKKTRKEIRESEAKRRRHGTYWTAYVFHDIRHDGEQNTAFSLEDANLFDVDWWTDYLNEDRTQDEPPLTDKDVLNMWKQVEKDAKEAGLSAVEYLRQLPD